jgi:hypothetical protein
MLKMFSMLYQAQMSPSSNSMNDISQHTWIIINFVNFFSYSELY